MMRQQRWSLAAHQCVLAKQTKDEKEKEEKRKKEANYKTHAIKMPSILQRAGLIQALVFLKSRTEGTTYLDDLAKVYGTETDALLERAKTADLAGYLALSRDIMDVAIWFRRFAQIELKGEEE
jgi:CRISPR-associated protein Cmr5